MTEGFRPVSRGVVMVVTSVAFLLGMHVDALARVIWVEDRVDDSAIVDIVNGDPPSLIILTILALAGMGLGALLWVRDRRTGTSR